MRRIPALLFSVSYTTRSPRAGEQNGREYWFVSREKFKAMIAGGEFLEYALVFDSYYGTHRGVWEKAEREQLDLVLDIDVQGAAQVKKKIPDAIGILLIPPSAQELERRLHARELDSAEVIQRRLAMAHREIERYQQFDYLVVNGDLSEACAQVEAVVRVERQERGHDTSGVSEEEEGLAAEAWREANLDKLSGILKTFGAGAG